MQCSVETGTYSILPKEKYRELTSSLWPKVGRTDKVLSRNKARSM